MAPGVWILRLFLTKAKMALNLSKGSQRLWGRYVHHENMHVWAKFHDYTLTVSQRGHEICLFKVCIFNYCYSVIAMIACSDYCYFWANQRNISVRCLGCVSQTWQNNKYSCKQPCRTGGWIFFLQIKMWVCPASLQELHKEKSNALAKARTSYAVLYGLRMLRRLCSPIKPYDWFTRW